MKHLKIYDQFNFDDFSEEDLFGEDYGSLTKFEDLVGVTIIEIIVDDLKQNMIFKLKNGDEYILYHQQNCCEQVEIDDINGDLDDLLNTPILKASEDTNRNEPRSPSDESFTWTFYNLSTIKGYVTIRWYGSSNGWYSEKVDFAKVERDNNNNRIIPG